MTSYCICIKRNELRNVWCSGCLFYVLRVYVIIERNKSHNSVYCTNGNYAGIPKALEYCANLNPVLIIQVITKSDQSYLIDRLGGAVLCSRM